MSKNYFNNHHQNNQKIYNINIETKIYKRDMFNTPKIYENYKKPITLVSKSTNKKIQKEETPKQKSEKKPVILNRENRDFSKKAKTTPYHSKSSRRIKTEINKKNYKKNNENFAEKIEQKLKKNYSSKREFNHKKENKNDFLKCAINLNADPDFDSGDGENIEQNKDTNPIILTNNNNNNIKEDINNLNPTNFININNNNNNIEKLNEENKNTNEALKEKEKDIQKENKKKLSSSKNIYKSYSIKNEVKNRPSIKKDVLRSYSNFKIEGKANPFSYTKKYTLKNSSIKNFNEIKNSMKQSIIRNNSIRKNINNIIIPLLNRARENNCFLNVIIQSFFHSTEFKKELLENNEYLSKYSRTINEIYKLLKSYSSEQVKNKDNKNQIEPILSVNDLRNYLNEKYRCYHPGEAGDPMETIGYIFDLIHKVYCRIKGINYKTIENCKCPIHQHFLLKLVDIISCPYCNVKKVQMYDKDCFMFNIFIKDLTNKLNNQSYNSYKLKLFSKLKELNEIYENENKIKIPGCNCNLKRMSSYEKKLKLNGPTSTYLILNITWAEEFPSMMEILKAYGLIPISESIGNLFTFGEDLKTKINEIYYIKSIILYGLYHYVCILYIKEERRWVVIDDKTIKYFNKYFDLIDFLLRNHLMPVGLIYSKDRNDEINESEIKLHSLNRDEYIKLYQFCKDVDIRRGLKVSDLVLSKGSFNENNENYLNNNYFYNSIIDLFSSDDDINKKPNLVINNNNLKIEGNKTDIIKKVNIYDKDVNIQIPENNFKTEIIKNTKVMGNFSDKNMRGGLILLSSSLSDNN